MLALANRTERGRGCPSASIFATELIGATCVSVGVSEVRPGTYRQRRAAPFSASTGLCIKGCAMPCTRASWWRWWEKA